MNLFRMFLVGVGCVLCITIVLYLFFLPLAQPNQAKPLFRSLIEVRLEDQIPEDQLLGIVKSAAELRKRTEGYRRHAFNVLISDRIGWHRSLPDVRPDRCRNQTYVFKPSESLSIIICFHNEALSTLLRTVQSVLMRSDHALVHEILVINDFSTGLTITTLFLIQY